MKMPETLYIGVCDDTNDYVNPDNYGRHEVSYVATELPDDAVATPSDWGYVAEYRLVRRLRVTKTVPEPIINVTEV